MDPSEWVELPRAFADRCGRISVADSRVHVKGKRRTTLLAISSAR